ASLGYGDFIGTFAGSNQPASNNGVNVEKGLVAHDPAEFNGINLTKGASWTGTSAGNMTFTMTEFKHGDLTYATGGNWIYNGQDAETLFVTLKYGSSFSVFKFEDVKAGDTGVF